MKVLISRLSDGTVGGAEISARDQAIVLGELGHNISVASTILVDRKYSINTKTYHLPWIHKNNRPTKIFFFPIMWFYLFVKCLMLLHKVKPDIINPQSRDDQIIFTITKFIHKKPVIWKDPGDLHFFLDSYLKKKSLYLRLYFFAAKKTDYIYTLNEEDVELIKKMTCSNNVVAISSDILFEDYNLTAEPLYKKSLIVGFIGRIEASKNLETLIKAMDLIYKDIECWIIGDGSDKKRLMNLASENSKIKFFKRTNDISKFYNTFDIFVQPAVVEGWGRNVKEAMYFGIPVIGANVGGIKKQVINGKTGYLFNPADVKELAVKINTLCNNESIRKKIGIAGKKKVLADGDFRNVVKNEIIPLYETALKKKS